MQFYGKIVLLIIAAVLVCGVQSRSAGPPANEPANRNQVCNNMMPNHGAGAAAQVGNGGYTISTDLSRISDTEYAYMADQTYAGKLTACGVDLYII